MDSKVSIVFCPGKDIFPAFGLADVNNQTAYVSQDLPGPVKKFVVHHELFHLKDARGHWLWRELKANLAGTMNHPLGFVWCVILSLQPYRLRFYLHRFRTGA